MGLLSRLFESWNGVQGLHMHLAIIEHEGPLWKLCEGRC